MKEKILKIITTILGIVILVILTYLGAIYFGFIEYNVDGFIDNITSNKVNDVELVQKELSIKKGENFPLVAVITPVNASEKGLEWSSSNNNVAVVDENGKVTGIETGTAVIIVKTLDGEYTDSCVVTVKLNDENIKITLNKTSQSLKVGGSVTLTATISPSNASNKGVTWTSSNNNVVTVSNGVVKAVGVGSAYIYATSKENPSKKASCAITVSSNTENSSTVNVNSITLNKASQSLKVGGSVTLTATISPSNASNKGVTWTSSNNNVVTVNNGVVKAVGVGSAYIYATSKENASIKTSCIITVSSNTIAVSSITLNKTSQSLKVGGSVTLTATISPSNASNKGVTWTSSNKNVATVSNGVVKAVGVGSAYIYATSKENTTIKASCIITVTESVNPQATTSANLRAGYSLSGEYNSDTLKFWIEKGTADGSTVYVAHIWVKNAYNQLKTALSSNWGKGFEPSTTIFKNEISNKNLTNKGAVAINASGGVNGTYSYWLYAGANGVAGIPEWKYTSVSPIVIHDGKVLRNFTNKVMPEPLYSVSGLKKDGWINQYNWSNGSNISYNQNVANQIINDGVKYTWGFVGFLIKNGSINVASGGDSATRSAIGQIDKNNFVLVSGGNFTLHNLAKYLMNDYSCKYAINLDGGGSSSMSYKLKGTNEITRLRKSDRAITDILYFSE